jgi:hypothetical protein
MMIEIDDEYQAQAIAAGFASVEQYVEALLFRDADRLAIEEGIAAAEAGKTMPWDEFDRQFRLRNGIAPRERGN